MKINHTRTHSHIHVLTNACYFWFIRCFCLSIVFFYFISFFRLIMFTGSGDLAWKPPQINLYIRSYCAIIITPSLQCTYSGYPPLLLLSHLSNTDLAITLLRYDSVCDCK